MYYRLERDSFAEPGPYRIRCSGWNEDWDDGEFLKGKRIELEIRQPFEFELWESKKGRSGLAEFFYEAFPIMRDDMVTALINVGADNFEVFPAILRDPKRDLVLTNYKVVNIIGLIKAVDLAQSDYVDMGGTGLIAVGFKEMAVDVNKTHGALIYRPAESVSDIIIHERVKQEFERSGFKYLRCLPCK